MSKKVDRSEMWSLLRQTWPYLKDSKWKLVGYIITRIIMIGVGIATPIVSAWLILYLTDGAIQQLIYAAIAVAIIDCVGYLSSWISGMLYQRIYRSTMLNLQTAVAREMLRIETSSIDRTSSGVFIDRLSQDTSEMSTIFSDYSAHISRVTGNVGVLVSIFFLNKYLFVWAVVTALISLGINRVRIHRQVLARKEFKKIHEKQSGLVNEIVRGVKDAKMLNATDNLLAQTRQRIKDSSDAAMRVMDIGRRYMLAGNEANMAMDLVFIILGCALYSWGLLTIPTFVIVYNFRNRVRDLLTGLVSITEQNKYFALAANRVYGIIGDKEFKKEQFGEVKLPKLEGDITFKDVHFGYEPDREVLKGVDFHVKPNERVAFVGRSGAGKTTIFNLITRMYHVGSGEVLLDGHEIETLTRDSIRNNMSVITQNPYIFNFSIKDNLLLAKPKASMKQLRAVCKAACIDDYIMSLPDQYDTMVGENGVILSGGQRQRLAIARALLKKTEIILFDEATSALDNETQAEIQQAIANMQGEYTILIVAHRLSTIVDSDRIFVLDGGKIIAEGTHNQLLKTCDFYRELYSKDLEH